MKSNLCWPCIHGCIAFHWSMINLPRSTLLRKADSPSSSSFHSPKAVLQDMKVHVSSISIEGTILLELSLLWFMFSQPQWVHMCSFCTVYGGHCFSALIHHLWFFLFVSLNLQWSLGLGIRRHNINVPFSTEHSTVSYFLHHNHV